MSNIKCPYCDSGQAFTRVKKPHGHVSVCRNCERVVEECCTDVQELFVETTQDVPLCIVTPDFSKNERYKIAPVDGDMFEDTGFITAFSTTDVAVAPTFTATSRSLPGVLAEMERVVGDVILEGADVSVEAVAETLMAYVHILDTCSLLGLRKDIADKAFQLFRECFSSPTMRNKSVEVVAVAALVHALRDSPENKSLQEVAQAANISQKELTRHVKLITDTLKLNQPAINGHAAHMARFCGILQLNQATEDLATHIGEVVIKKTFCTRRNPISISAAAIYLSCQLEDKRKTQSEICKATGLTEVTLRKVYKELLEHLEELLPDGYIPAVSLEKAFPITAAAALGRVSSLRLDRSTDSSDLGSLSRQSSLSALDTLARSDSLLSRQGSLDASVMGNFLAQVGVSPRDAHPPGGPGVSPQGAPTERLGKGYQFLERTSSTGGQLEEFNKHKDNFSRMASSPNGRPKGSSSPMKPLSAFLLPPPFSFPVAGGFVPPGSPWEASSSKPNSPQTERNKRKSEKSPEERGPQDLLSRLRRSISGPPATLDHLRQESLAGEPNKDQGDLTASLASSAYLGPVPIQPWLGMAPSVPQLQLGERTSSSTVSFDIPKPSASVPWPNTYISKSPYRQIPYQWLGLGTPRSEASGMPSSPSLGSGANGGGQQAGGFLMFGSPIAGGLQRTRSDNSGTLLNSERLLKDEELGNVG